MRIQRALVISCLALAGAVCARQRSALTTTTIPALDTPAAQTPVGPVPATDDGRRRRQNPYRADDAAVLVDGRRLFVRFNCSGCHGGRAGGGMGPSLRDVDWLYGNTDAQIFSSITEGRAHGMPAWGGQVTEEQIWKLVTYIRSLRTAAEPNPPR